MNTKLIEEIKSNIRAIRALERDLKEAVMTSQERKRGLEVSKVATQHPNEVPMTPIMRNMLFSFGDIDEESRLLTDSGLTRAEKWLYDTCNLILLKQSGKKTESYNEAIPMRSIQHYYTDCWLNLKENWRDIVPGQIEEINEMIHNYVRPTSDIDIMRKLDNPIFAKAVEVVVDELPSVSATHEIVEINLPFMTKHTNVGYPSFSNDRSINPANGLTYAEDTMNIAKQLKDKPEQLWRWNVTTEFARFQRGKGRLIQAISRVPNLVFNQLEAVEIANYKAKCPMFAGYNDDVYLQYVLTKMLKDCEENGLVLHNLDYHRFDKTVTRDFIELLGAISAYKCTDLRSKKLAMYRAAFMTKTSLVAGTLDDVLTVFGRIFSGFIDTNRGGGLINGINMTNLAMIQDEHYVRDIVAKLQFWILVMGDDVLLTSKSSLSMSRLKEDAAKYNFEIDDPTKNAFGPKFLQYRVFEDEDGNLVMAYPWTRVLRSMLWKEHPAGRGPCGWTLTFYQQLAKLEQYKPALAVVTNLAAMFDRDHLMLDVPVRDIIAGAIKEDEEAEVNKKYKSQKRRHTTIAEQLNDGDPSKARQFRKSDQQIEPNYFEALQVKLREVYDPSFLSTFGLSVPKLRV